MKQAEITARKRPEQEMQHLELPESAQLLIQGSFSIMSLIFQRTDTGLISKGELGEVERGWVSGVSQSGFSIMILVLL